MGIQRLFWRTPRASKALDRARQQRKDRYRVWCGGGADGSESQLSTLADPSHALISLIQKEIYFRASLPIISVL
jgi:hypothetical protein